MLLGDLPASVSGKRLGDGVLRSALTNLGLVIATTAATVAAEITHRLPGAVTASLVTHSWCDCFREGAYARRGLGKEILMMYFWRQRALVQLRPLQ